jgi:hypothetical protein
MLEIHLLSEDVDEVVTIGDEEGADVPLDEVRDQIPDRTLDDLLPRIFEAGHGAFRMVMMYHAALAHIDRNDLWGAGRITFSVRLAERGHSVAVD